MATLVGLGPGFRYPEVMLSFWDLAAVAPIGPSPSEQLAWWGATISPARGTLQGQEKGEESQARALSLPLPFKVHWR